MNILMIGSGYVGLVTGASFAEMGHHVISLDIDEKKIAMLKKGKIPIYEPGLEELIKRNVKAGRLKFTTSYQEGVKSSQAIFIGVPTPSSQDGSCNTSYIEAAAKSIGNEMNEYKIIINKSTSPVGTAALIRQTIQTALNERDVQLEFDVASNPEFLKEGSALSDCMKPDRVVIGTDNEKAEKKLREIYSPFMLNHERLIAMDIASSELTKYAANAMLATRISFMNELAEISKKVGADINQIRKGIGSDRRIGYSFLYAGVGYGGSCFPKDIRALSSLAEKKGCHPVLLKAVETINVRQKKLMGTLLEDYFAKKGGIRDKTIAIWGLAFKPDTDDIREAPALELIRELQRKGVKLKVYDPIAMENVQNTLENQKNLSFCKDELDAAQDADAICLLTEWKQFRLFDFDLLSKAEKRAVIFDGRNQYKAQDLNQKGFDYVGIGMKEQFV